MADPTIELGEFALFGYHYNEECDGGKVFRQTPQRLNGELWPPSVYEKPDAMLEWHWCKSCGGSTRNDTLDMKDVK